MSYSQSFYSLNFRAFGIITQIHPYDIQNITCTTIADKDNNYLIKDNYNSFNQIKKEKKTFKNTKEPNQENTY